MSVQPSEFVKPTFAVVAAWLFSEQKLRPRFPGNLICIALFLAVAGMLIKQPDIGMAAVVAAVWFAQFFMAGLRLYWVVVGAGAGLGGLVGAYLYLPHVRSRIDHFLDPSAGDSYQVNRSIEAFANGGLWGRGPGEGTVKDVLPDAHADFVFAVAGEEFGLVVCLAIIALFAFIVLRGLFATAAGRQSFCDTSGDGPADPVRPTSGRQHGIEPALDPDQGNDLAVSVLRRILDAGTRDWHGNDAGADPAPAWGKRAVSLPFVLAAGGTGGHVFPAEALAAELVAHGRRVHLLCDERTEGFARNVAGVQVHHVRAGRLGGGRGGAVYGLAEMAMGVMQARRLLRRLAPASVIGFGGYPSVPTMLAARYMRVPTAIHEQNAVLGRANRLLAPRALRIATGFPVTAGLRPADRPRAVHTGNPVRPAILAVGDTGYTAPHAGEPIELLILGGSQGAHVLGEIVPPAIAALSAGLRGRLRISQQARPEDRASVAEHYQQNGIAADLPQLLRRRSGKAGASASGDLPGRSLDRGRTCGPRPPSRAGPLPSRHRRPSDGQRPRLRRGRGWMGRTPSEPFA